MKQLVKMRLDFGRTGTLESMFICTLDELNALYGKWCTFGEVMGKHSNVECLLDAQDFTVIYVPLDSVEAIEEAVGKSVCGPNPFNYV